MRVLFLAIFFALLSCSTCQALDIACPEVWREAWRAQSDRNTSNFFNLKRPNTIPRFQEKVFRAEAVYDYARLKEAVTILDLKAGQKFTGNELKDGVYSFAIAVDGRMAFSNRAIRPRPEEIIRNWNKANLHLGQRETIQAGVDAFGNAVQVKRVHFDGLALMKDDATYLCTHDSLALVLANGVPQSGEFVTAGEFVVRGGKLQAVTNMAGTYPSGVENLEFGFQAIKESGLPIADTFRYADVSKDPKALGSAHAVAAKQAYVEAVIELDSDFTRLYKETIEVMKEADRGGLDAIDVANLEFLEAAFENDYEELGKAALLLKSWAVPAESMPERMLSTLDLLRNNHEKYMAILTKLRRAIELKKSAKKPQPIPLLRQ